MRRTLRTLSLVALAGFAAGCSRDRETGARAGQPVAPPSSKAASTGEPSSRTVLDLLGSDDACTLGHRGTLIDLGEPASLAHVTSAGRLAVPNVEVREHEGATWAVVRERALSVSFLAMSEAEGRSDAGSVVEMRVRGGVARSVAVSLGGKAAGSASLPRGAASTVRVRLPPGLGVTQGVNELGLRFVGGPRGTADVLAEIDWIRVGPDTGESAYAAPTRRDAVTTTALAGVPHRSIALRGPGFARCVGWLPAGASLEGFIGVAGGEAEAEVRVLVDRQEPRVVGAFRLGAPGSAPGWQPIALPLGDLGTLGAVELAVTSSSKGARVMFAEPKVVVPSAKAAPPKPSSGVLLVVLGSTPRRALAPYGGSVETPVLASLATGGAVFESHRSPTSFAGGALASMLTGLSPRAHGVVDADAALPPSAFTLAEAARRAGVVTAMFTANPTTTTGYGFARGWETFASRMPSEEASATVVFDEAARWLESRGSSRFFAVVHARGGHPPWSATADEITALPPAGYAGTLEAKHAGEMLAKAKKGGARLFGDADKERAFALHRHALAAHDAALGRLLGTLAKIGRDETTTVIVTGDVGIDGAAHVPFLEEDTLDESLLAVPLVVRGEGMPRGARVTAPTTAVDVTRTVLAALDLPPPSDVDGESLFQLARTETAVSRPALAVSATRFSARWGSFVMQGLRDREGKVCDLSLEPECVEDVRASHPLASEALHAYVFREIAVRPRAVSSPRATLDAQTAAALRAWGR